MSDWDPDRYLRFADERSRPFFDLVSQVRAEAPERVVDLGCGPGHLAVALAERWPTAAVVGVDSSAAMIDKARRTQNHPRVGFEQADVRDWRPDEPVDVIVTNATLQWLPDHRELLGGFVDALRPGGWFAMGVPGNHDAPSHALLRELAADPRFAAHTAGVERPAAAAAEDYLADLAGLGCTVDAWETTYLHVLEGEDPVFTWISGTGARPVLQALPSTLRSEFESRYQAALRSAYPTRPYGTVLPFRRVFAVARKPG
jgi:trans-aconitate 2-methyltransferase